MNASRRIIGPLLALATVFLTSPLNAQSVYGQVSGRLVSASGAPVSGASVTLTSVATDARVRTESDPKGYITIANLSADLYQIEVRAEGFKSVQGTVAVSADSTSSVNATLQPGDPNTLAKNSEAGASVLKLDRTDVSTLFDARAINELPLLDRNLTTLQLLVPGAALGELYVIFNQNPQNSQPVNINGQHFSGSAFQLDGAENRDPLEGLVVINPTLDSAKEMKVTTQGYNAEFGQATAGVVTIQTNSGSNAWHGDVFGFRRTGFGQSENPFDPAGVPPSKYNIFGGSIGGPIAKNKLFIFGDYQGTRSSQSANALLSVPPLSVRQTCLGSAGAAGSLCDLSAYSPLISGTLVDPYRKDSRGNPEQFTCPQVSGPPVPCNEIPNTPSGTSSSVANQAVAILSLLPLPNHTPNDPTCAVNNGGEAVCNNYLASGQEVFNGGEAVCNNYLASGQEVFSGDQFDLRADYNANSRLRLFGRYSFGNFRDNGTPAFGTEGGGIGVDPSGFAGIAQTRNQGLSTGFTYSLSPKLLTDFRFGYLRYRLNLNAQDNGQTPALGIPGIFAADTGDPFATGLPDFQIPGQPGLSAGDYLRLGYSSAANSCNCPLREREQQFQFVNNWTRSAGRHIIKWGADLRFLQNYRLASDRPRTGFFSFAPITGLGLATFLIGDATSFNRSFSSSAALDAGEHQKRFGFYGQDTWRINSRLTVNYGLRWEIYFPQTVTGAGGFLIPNLSNHDPAATFFGGPPAGGVAGNLTNFAPRLGIAYLINPTTVVRAGYGRSFDAGYAGDLFGVAATQNPPVTVDQNNQLTVTVDQNNQLNLLGTFNLAQGPPRFVFPTSSHFSLLDLAAANIGAPNQLPPQSASGAILYALPSRVRVPTVDSWNLTIQHELNSHLYFELAYVGDKGTHVFADSNAGTYYDLNQPSLQNSIAKVTIVNNRAPSFCRKNSIFIYPNSAYCFVMPAFRSFYEPVPITQPPNCTSTAPCFFNPTLFQVRYFGNNANDNYNSVQAKVLKNFNRGYSFMAHYTWSKGLDYDANFFAVDPRIGYGPDSFDIRHRFVMTNIWDLPIGRGKAWLGGIGPVADRFFGGWTISAITVWRSGFPFTPTYKECQLDVDPSSPCRPNRVGLVTVGGGRDQYFLTTSGNELQGNDCIPGAKGKPTKFCGVDANGNPVPGTPIGPWQRPAIGQIGTAGRNSFTGPRFFQSDIGLAKMVRVTEHSAVRFRADAINAFNKVNLGNPNPCVDCAGGGAISSLALGSAQRRLQFSLRIEF